MTTILFDDGLTFGNTAAAPQLLDLSVSNSTPVNTLTITLQPCSLAFRNTTATTGTPTVVRQTTAVTLNVSTTDSFGLTTAYGNQRIAILAINNAGVIELAASALYGGVALDETGVITTATTSTTATGIKSTAVRTGVAYRVVGFVDATFTTAVGWGTLALVQSVGGQALAAMSSLGYGQTWQNVTGSRAIATTYYNTTGKPIQISVTCSTNSTGNGARASLSIGGVVVAYSGTSAVTSANTGETYPLFQAIIIPGQTYSVQNVATAQLLSWFELR